jgi:hypothetical protein
MATVYIKPGSGTGTGTLADPYYFDQLGTAETAAGSGGKILFTDGTYTQGSALSLGASNVTYEALNSKQAILEFGSSQRLDLGRSSDSFAGFSLKGLVFQNVSTGLYGASELEIANGELLTCESCEFLNINSGTRSVFGSGNNSNTGAMNATFTGCIFTCTQALTSPFFGYRVGTTHALTLNNCTLIFSGAGAAVFLKNSQGSFTVKNSILLSDGSNKTLGSPTPFTESNNCYFGIGESADTANSIIVDDPQFVDSANGDYRLRPSSPCINAGTAS